MKKRLFLALPAIIDDYESIQNDFSDVISGRWTPPENLHLTLSFYGNQFDQDELVQQLSTLKFDVTPSIISGLGYFKRNRILYANVENPALASVYKTLNTLFDLPVTREFIPHMTLMRIKKIVDEDTFYDQLDIYKDREIGSLGSSLELMQSELHSDGAKYSLIKRF
ncbi:MAG: RNA 2',3'-cyclic phosphodiesterase [Sulfurimonadaceae bacterium]